MVGNQLPTTLIGSNPGFLKPLSVISIAMTCRCVKIEGKDETVGSKALDVMLYFWEDKDFADFSNGLPGGSLLGGFN